MRGLEWNWKRVIVIEVVNRKNGMGMDGNKWKENKDANRHEKHMRVVMSGDEGDEGEIEWKRVWNKE